MKKLSAFPDFIPLLLALALLITVVPSVHGQAIVSPTPDFDGNIYYMVQGNDTYLSISLKMGIEIETLRQLNDLDVDCSLIADTRLLLGRILTATPTSGPTPTPTLVLPTPTPYDGNASVCIYLFDDLNGNSTVQGGENRIPVSPGSLAKLVSHHS